jgi:hypothetical protein
MTLGSKLLEKTGTLWAVYTLRFRKSHKILAIAKKNFGGMFLHRLCKASIIIIFFFHRPNHANLKFGRKLAPLPYCKQEKV